METERAQILHRFRILRQSLRRNRHHRIGIRHGFQQHFRLFLDRREAAAAVLEAAACILRNALEGEPDSHSDGMRIFKETLGQQRAVRGHFIERRLTCLNGFQHTSPDCAVDQSGFEQRLSAEEAETSSLARGECEIHRRIHNGFRHADFLFLVDTVSAVHITVFGQVQSQIHAITSL